MGRSNLPRTAGRATHYKFYGISDEGPRFLAGHKLLRAEEILREIYDRIEKVAETNRHTIRYPNRRPKSIV